MQLCQNEALTQNEVKGWGTAHRNQAVFSGRPDLIPQIQSGRCIFWVQGRLEAVIVTRSLQKQESDFLNLCYD